MEAAVTLIYQRAEGAEEICAHILQKCTQQALERLQEDDGQKAGEEKAGEGNLYPWYLVLPLHGLE